MSPLRPRWKLKVERVFKIHATASYGIMITSPKFNGKGTSFEQVPSANVEESPNMLFHCGNKFEVFQMKQGFCADLPATKISEMMKSKSLDSAPTQSLLSLINGILDESIGRDNAQIPQAVLQVYQKRLCWKPSRRKTAYRVACLLRKVVQEIERRIATQAEQLRTQSNLFKTREEKYKSRIRVLETLAKGTSEETEIVMNQLQYIKSEKNKMEEKKKFEQLEAANLKKQKDESNVEISTLKQELQMAKKTHELRYLELETEANMVKSDLEKRLRQQEQFLEDSKIKMKELELNSQSVMKSWTQKEHIYERFIDIQWAGLQELRHSSETIKQDMLKTQKTYLEELNHIGTKLKKIAQAAQSYHEVLNENRKIYNELQDLKGNIRVYCRVRPFLPGENIKQSIIEDIGEHGELTITNPSKPKDAQKSFRFNKVYSPMATQADVFSDTQPLIRTILDGYNVCVFAYGQTGSGKTYTMSGPDNASKEDWGVNYRALDDLFQISEDRRSFFLYEIGVQMIEIYNEQLRDLLSNDGSQKKLGILTTIQPNGLPVPDASMHPVRCTADVIELMNIGLANRAVSATAMNERSSRSHSVVTIHVQGTDLKTGATSHGSLHLVDLAGSERVDRSEATGDRLREAQHINKSLSALGDVIFALAQKSPHVPYRNSKLTQVLQTSLGGRAKTLMFVQINPDGSSYSETLSTLKFAERVSGVELGAARSNKDGRDVRELMDQVASLKDAIAKKDEEIERLHLLRDPKTPQVTLKHNISSLKNGLSSPSARSMGSNKSGNSGSLNATYEIEQEGLRSSRSMNDLKGHKNSSPRHSKFYRGTSMDDDSLGMEDGDDDDERLSEISDGDLSVGIDTDGSLDGSKQSESSEKHREKSKTPTRLSQPSRLATQTGASRLSKVKTTLRATAALKKPASGSSSPVTPGSARR